MILIGLLIYEIYERIYQNRPALFPFALLLVVLIPSNLLKNIDWTVPDEKVRVSLYQPNLTLEDKWSQFGIIKTQGMIERAIENAEEGELIIFPETALIL